MNTIKIEVSTKKGEAQPLRFLVQQSIPYPCIQGDTSRLRWVNYEGLFTNHGHKAEGIPEHYTCYLLSDTAPDTATGDDRSEFAGYQPTPGYGQPQKPANGGTLKIRGKDLGEMYISFGIHGMQFPTIKVRNGEAAHGVEREIITQQIIPKLVQFINENYATLREQAITKVKARFARQLAQARKQLDELEAQATQATY